MTRTRTFLMASALAVLACAPAIAGAPVAHPEKGKHLDHMIERMDTDKNGTVSEKEFMNKSQKMFRKLDADKNGQITRAEFQSGHEKMKQKRDARKQTDFNQ